MKLQQKACYVFLLAVGVSCWMFAGREVLDIIESASYGRQLVRNGLSSKQSGESSKQKTDTEHLRNNIIAGERKSLKNDKGQIKHRVNLNETSSTEPLYKSYELKKTRTITLEDDKTKYFTETKDGLCLVEGSRPNNVTNGCKCKKGWHGQHCSFPDLVDETKFLKPDKLKIRPSAPRRIIYGITFNIEFELLEIRFKEMGDLIDVIIILESNYTGFGERKGLYLLEKLRSGFLKEYQEKILYLYMDFFPTNQDTKDGAYTDFYMKNYPGRKGLEYIKGTRTDDLFIVADADEIHRREALLFLKLHDGYPEPFGIRMRGNCFGYFWKSGETVLGIGSSLAMLKEVYDNYCSEVRGATSEQHKYMSQLESYKAKGNYVQMWQIGMPGPSPHIGGWHCSWCFGPERIVVKLLSAPNYDFPRWGDYSEKTELTYIKDLIKVGLWFDEQSTFEVMYPGRDAPYAPSYVLNNPSKYKNIIFNPYRPL